MSTALRKRLSQPLRAIATGPLPSTEVAAVTAGRRRLAAIAVITIATCTSTAAATTGTATTAATVNPFVLFVIDLFDLLWMFL